MQRIVDGALGIAKESVKTFTQETFNNTVRFINGISAILLSLLPGNSSILEGVHGWELRPTFRAPRLPRWMEEGASSFNEFIHDLSIDFDSGSEGYDSGQEDYEDSIAPSSPSSQASRASRASRISRSSSIMRNDRYTKSFLKSVFGWVFWPLKIFSVLKWFFFSSSDSARKNVATPPPPKTGENLMHHTTQRMNSIKDQMLQRTTDRRRGLIEDSQLLIEIAIELVFDFVRKSLHFMLSPLETCRSQLERLIFKPKCPSDEPPVSNNDADTQESLLGENNTRSTFRPSKFQQSLNADSRTCEDIITELGYPYEPIRVITADGYILLLERIPRRDSKRVVYLQHGVFDSSLGWVSNGVVGSQAFAAYDQGYDVFLGNFRGLASREHTDKNISSRRYWRYSVNEHATQDIPAMIEKIHSIKISELEQLQLDKEILDNKSCLPYTLCAVSHSLGGAAMLMYTVTRCLSGIPHRLSRLILLSPAGFHEDSPIMFQFFKYFFPICAPILGRLMPGFYIPTKFFRLILNKLARDLQNYPALGGLAQTLFSYIVGGDSSNWVGVIGTPHYNMFDMPGVSYRAIVHLAQMKRANKFLMYDFGSAQANWEAYGTPYPLDIAANYGVIDIPVDLVAGRKDKLIPTSMVKKHYRLMKESGVDVSYVEFEYAHLDFTFSHREELLAYVMSCLTSKSTVENGDRKDSKVNQSSSGKKNKDGCKRLKRKFRKNASRESSNKPEVSLDDIHQANHDNTVSRSVCSSDDPSESMTRSVTEIEDQEK